MGGFEVGDRVVYPPHGAGEVTSREVRDVLGVKRAYLTVRILSSDMTLMVPADGAEEAGLRPVMDAAGLARLEAVLEDETDEEPGPFSRRFRQSKDRIRTGDPFELGGVIRNLTLREREKPLSSGERQLLEQARRVLASEVAYARRTDEDEALAWLDARFADGTAGVAADGPRS